jgi:tetratricopeptide (TPR) repeat protein
MNSIDTRRLAAICVVGFGLLPLCCNPRPVVAQGPTALQLPDLPNADEGVEAISASGQFLRRPPPPNVPSSEFLDAEQKYRADPTDIDTAIWYGRRLAYTGRYREAIQIFTEAIEHSPRDPRLYRHRGHRWITLRLFDHAIVDLEFAASLIGGTDDVVEPDGQPNAAGIPTSTLHTNIWYHLGLARFLKGDYAGALPAYEHCLAASGNDDMRVATLYWRFHALARAKGETAAIESIQDVTPDLKLLENHSYHRLLLHYRGLITHEELIQDDATQLDRATIGFGIGHWRLVRGDRDRAQADFESVVADVEKPGTHWAAFGFIAAEAELTRAAQR